MINIIEIKARSEDHATIRAKLKEENAIYKGTDHQIDIYFNVSNGRLKLRKGKIENNLIHYVRENVSGPKHSVVSLYKSNAESNLESILDKAIGTKVVVDKKREIYFIRNVKFHIDTVESLGSFIEIEAIDETGERTVQELDQQCKYYLSLFKIKETDLVTCSYSDLMLEK